MLHWFLAKLPALDLVNFSDQTVFHTVFLIAFRFNLIVGMEVNHHVLQIEFEFRYSPSIFGEITSLET